MKMRMLIIALILAATPAHAGFVVAAIGSLFSAVGGAVTAIGATKIGAFLLRTLVSVGLSLLSRALQKKPRTPGLVTEATTSGGITPQKIIVGLYATGGQFIAPPNSYNNGQKAPRALLVYAIALSVVPGLTLRRVIINDAYEPLSTTHTPNLGFVGLGNAGAFAYVDFFDGSQTTADPGMIAAFGADPDRPWLADMVGPGTAWLKAQFEYNRERFNGLPSVRVEVMGIPLYDPRLDSSAGGTGPHRWTTPATWTQTANPVVIAYNILRGIALPDGDVWGGEASAEDLPLANWAAAMNECDLVLPGGTEPQFQCGFEIALDDDPADILVELLKTCSGQIVEIGGTWKVRVGPPALPTYFLTDDDILVTREQEYLPFPGLSDTYNAISSTYPEPESLWEAKEAPPRYSPQWEADDGNRRLIVPYDLPACPFGEQVQRLMTAMIADHRRFRAHRFGLPPEAAVLEPLETLSWTSQRNGYTAKVFEITGLTDHLMSLTQAVALRERDSGDYAWNPAQLITSSPSVPGLSPLPAQSVPGFGVSADVLVDASGGPRRPVIRMVWLPGPAADARGIRWEARLPTQTEASLSGSHAAIIDGRGWITQGLLPDTDYVVRGRLIADRPTDWTGWLPVRTGDIRLTTGDLAQTVWDAIDAAAVEAAAAAGILAVDTLPAFGDRVDQVVLKRPEMVLYRWTGSVWSTEIYAAPAPGSVSIAQFASGLRPVEVVASLPATGNVTGRTVFLTTDSKTYRWTGSAWTAAVAAVDVTGQLSDAQLAAIAAAKITGTISSPQIANGAVTDAKIAGMAAAKVTGQLSDAQLAAIAAAKITGTISSPQIANGAVTDAKIAGMAAAKVTGQLSDAQLAGIAAAKITGAITSTQISDDAITTPKIAAGAITASEIAAGTITSAQIAAGTITAADIAAGTITSAQIAAGTIQASNIAADTITGDKIAANAITTSELAAGAVTAAKITAGTITGDKIAANAITTGLIAAGTITAADIAAGTITSAQIAAGTIQASNIAADTITGDKIAANAITASELAVGSVTAVSIAAGTITSDKIAANTITSAQIAADAITTSELAAGAVTAAKITAGTITGDKIAANAITTGLIAAGAITANQIAAGEVTASKLAIRDTTNIVLNPTFSGGSLDGWDARAIGTSALIVDATAPSGYALEITRATSEASRTYPANFNNVSSFLVGIPVKVGDQLHLSGLVMSPGGAGNAVLEIVTRTAAGAIGSAIVAQGQHAAWTEISGAWTSGIDGVAFVRVLSATNAATIRLGRVELRRKNTGALIVDGAISANLIGAGQVTTNALAASSVIASKLAAGAVTADKITVADLSAISANLGTIIVGNANIGDAAINAAKIQDLTVGTIKIANNAITNGVTANATTGTTANGAIVYSRDVAISCAGGTPVTIWVKAGVAPSAENVDGRIRIYWNGSLIFNVVNNTMPPTGLILDEMISVTSLSGTNILRFESSAYSGSAYRFGPATLLELKK